MSNEVFDKYEQAVKENQDKEVTMTLISSETVIYVQSIKDGKVEYVDFLTVHEIPLDEFINKLKGNWIVYVKVNQELNKNTTVEGLKKELSKYDKGMYTNFVFKIDGVEEEVYTIINGSDGKFTFYWVLHDDIEPLADDTKVIVTELSYTYYTSKDVKFE